MPNFSYRARGRDGREIRGTLQAENEASAVSRIRESYPILLSITPLNEKKSLSGLMSMEIGSKRFKTKTLAILCSQFAITLRSGMPIARAMRMLAGQSGDKRLKRVMEEASEKVASGSTVASALEEYSERFPLTFIETIRAGEQSGTLDRSFERLHRFYEKSYRTTEKIKGALTYPIFVIVIAVVVVIIVMAKVIPTIANVFSDLGGELPLLTRMLIGASNFFAKYWILMLWDPVPTLYGLPDVGKYGEGKASKIGVCAETAACRYDQPDERISPVREHNVSSTGCRYHA